MCVWRRTACAILWRRRHEKSTFRDRIGGISFVCTQKKKARELEVAWDTREKALQKKSPDLWGQIDKAMDAFIKPVQDKSPDPTKVQTAYDTFIAKLQLAVKSDAEPKR